LTADRLNKSDFQKKVKAVRAVRSVELLLATFVALVSIPALAAVINIAGRNVVVVQPEAFCWLDANGSERLMAEQARKILSQTGQELLVMFGDCIELKGVRKGVSHTLQKHGSYTADINQRGLVALTKKTRAEIIRQVVQSLPTAASFSTEALVGLQNKANQILPGTITELRTPKVLTHDKNAVYVGGMAFARSAEGVNRIIATVTATTVVNGLVLNVIIHDQTKSEPYDFGPLLKASRVLANELVRLNP
jgi:hypothetical protein